MSGCPLEWVWHISERERGPMAKENVQYLLSSELGTE